MPASVHMASLTGHLISTYQERLCKNSFLKAPKDFILTCLLLIIINMILSNTLNCLEAVLH